MPRFKHPAFADVVTDVDEEAAASYEAAGWLPVNDDSDDGEPDPDPYDPEKD